MLAATVALFTALFALPQTAQAQTYYDLWIAGTGVTSANCNDLSVIAGVSGTVKYAPATKTLTLDNAAINYSGNDRGIESSIDGLTVELIGTNTVTAGGAKSAAVYHTQSMTIKGSGTLNATSSGKYGIYTVRTDLTIDGCTVNAKGVGGIAGLYGSESLTIRNATVTAEGSRGSISNFKTLSLDGCAITSPAGAVWNAGKHAVCDASGNIIKSKVTIKPVTFYDLEIAGTKVTSANCNNLSVIPGVSGTVEYDHSTRTLTLHNAAINAGGNEKGIYSQIDNLTVKLTGTNTVTAVTAKSAAVLHTKPMTLTGGGTLNAESTSYPGIYAYKTSLTIDGCTVNAKGEWGIAGYNGTTETLTIRNATVTAEGRDGSIRHFNTLTLEGCKITSPAGAVWNAEKKAVCDASGNIIKSKVTIKPVTFYDLEIAGTKVTSTNCNDLSVIPGVSGTVKYDHSTRTLTLHNATINFSSDNYGINSEIDNLTVILTGTNTVTMEDVAIRHTKPMTLTGGGTLEAQGTNGCGILVEETSLIIDGCTVNAKGEWGLFGRYLSSETLTIRNATVTAEGGKGSIFNFITFTLDGCAITSPAGAVWNDTYKCLCDALENVITDKVIITPVSTYDLKIAGTQVTSTNCNDLSVIDGVSGTVNYDHSTRTLTLDNATINAGGNEKGIHSQIDNLTVKLTGTNTVTAVYTPVLHTKPMTLTGGGTLNAESTNACGIFTDKTSLTIDGCTVNAKGKWGIAGNDSSSETLTIRNATVTAEGTAGSICDLRTLTLDGCAITSPAGAVWNDTKHAVCDAAGNIITDKVTIARDTNGIETVTADVPAGKRGVYNLQGVRLGDSLEHLPAGVYIYNGKKIIKK